MTVWSDNAAMVATTRGEWFRQIENVIFWDLERKLASEHTGPGKAALIAEAAKP